MNSNKDCSNCLHKAVLMSLNPKWVDLILQGVKKREVRKRAPIISQPFKVYLYCTKQKSDNDEEYLIYSNKKRKVYKGNGYVVGEATCVSITEYTRPFGNCIYGTCLTARELYEYAGPNDMLSCMALENPVMYDVPKPLADFGLKRAPQSWQYVEKLNDG